MDPIEIRLGINQRLLKEKQEGILQTKYLRKNPFSYAVIPNVLEKFFFSRIIKEIIALDKFEETGDGDIRHQHINSSDLLKVLLSTEIKEIIGDIFSCRIVRKKDQYPSVSKKFVGARNS